MTPECFSDEGRGGSAVLDLENVLLADLASRLGGEDFGELAEGGSPARIVRLRTGSGSWIVLKLLVDIPGAVDGHDLASFNVKMRQIAKVRAEVPELADVYTEMYDQFHGPGWSAYTMPYYPNEDASACLRKQEDGLPEFWTKMKRIVADITSHGYLRARVAAGPGQIRFMHTDRLARRFHLLERHLPAELIQPDVLVVNGRECRNPLRLAAIMSESRWLGSIEPAHLYYPVHGDLNTRNILITSTGYRIIDPRGTVDYWDPAYDIAKILFSLTVWDAGLRRGFDIDGDREWKVGVRGGSYPAYREAALGLLDRLRALPVFGDLTTGDPGWESRFALGHAFHLLAEAACRLSDIKKRSSEVADCPLSALELAAGHYLYGAMFLEDATTQMAEHGEIDMESALRLLDG